MDLCSYNRVVRPDISPLLNCTIYRYDSLLTNARGRIDVHEIKNRRVNNVSYSLRPCTKMKNDNKEMNNR